MSFSIHEQKVFPLEGTDESRTIDIGMQTNLKSVTSCSIFISLTFISVFQKEVYLVSHSLHHTFLQRSYLLTPCTSHHSTIHQVLLAIVCRVGRVLSQCLVTSRAPWLIASKRFFSRTPESIFSCYIRHRVVPLTVVLHYRYTRQGNQSCDRRIRIQGLAWKCLYQQRGEMSLILFVPGPVCLFMPLLGYSASAAPSQE